MLLTKVSIKYFLNTMAQLTLSLYILFLSSLYYMNMKHLRMGQKTVRKLEFMTKKHEIAEKDGGNNIFKSTIWVV